MSVNYIRTTAESHKRSAHGKEVGDHLRGKTRRAESQQLDQAKDWLYMAIWNCPTGTYPLFLNKKGVGRDGTNAWEVERPFYPTGTDLPDLSCACDCVGRARRADSTGGVFLTLTTPWACLYKPLSGSTTDGQSESSCLTISPRNVARGRF